MKGPFRLARLGWVSFPLSYVPDMKLLRLFSLRGIEDEKLMRAMSFHSQGRLAEMKPACIGWRFRAPTHFCVPTLP